jgi:hypothetical protein
LTRSTTGALLLMHRQAHHLENIMYCGGARGPMTRATGAAPIATGTVPATRVATPVSGAPGVLEKLRDVRPPLTVLGREPPSSGVAMCAVRGFTWPRVDTDAQAAVPPGLRLRESLQPHQAARCGIGMLACEGLRSPTSYEPPAETGAHHESGGADAVSATRRAAPCDRTARRRSSIGTLSCQTCWRRVRATDPLRAHTRRE